MAIRGSLLDHSWTILDHFADCTFNFVPMVLWTCGSFFGSYIVGTSEFPFWVHFFKTHCWSKMLLCDTYIWKLHLWIIFCNTNWWINMLFCVCSRCHLCHVCGSFFLLMTWWIISFTPCPFALVYSTFSNSGLVCVMSEPSSPAPRAVLVSELVVRKIADHFARHGGGGGGVMGWVIHDPRIIWWGGGGWSPADQ